MSRLFGASPADAITIANVPQLANLGVLTYAAFINPTGFGNPSAGRIFSKADSAGVGHSFFLQNVSGGQLVAKLSKTVSDAQAVAAFASTLFNGEWKFVAMTYQAGDGGPRLWIATHADPGGSLDKTQIKEATYVSRTDGSGTLVAVTALAPVIGNSAVAGGNAFQGREADVMVLGGVANPTELRQLMLTPRIVAVGKGFVPKLAHWPLDFQEKGQVLDITGGGAHAVSVAGTTSALNPSRETMGSSGW
jgi:Concanavalin A-like lectin/glucanases superfamily